jgi:hypothetical protein
VLDEEAQMTEHGTENSIQVSNAQLQERLRQERETFDQHKTHENQWFKLRLVMGAVAVILVPSIIVICVFVFLNHAVLPTAIVASASGALFVDVVGLVIAVWKVVLSPGFITKLAPVTQSAPITAVSESTPDESLKDKVKKITVLSAKYGKGEKTNDVTEIVRAIVAAAEVGSARFTVNNKTLAVGKDPFKGQGKELTIVYSYTGKTQTITVREREECSLPQK